ncbi:MAG: hypothetical protein ABFS12_03390 [Bacteroidota bacterium]
MKMKLKIFFLIVIALTSNSICQFSKINETFGMRMGSTLSHSIKYQEYRSTRFLPVVNNFNLNRWVSSKTTYIFNDLPVNVSLLNMSSLDLLPANLITNEITDTYDSDLRFQSGHSIGISSITIPDEFSISFRGYLGSQTGDQLIHFFTRDNTETTNINKIPPSGAISISNSNNKWGYRLTAGYYGFFSTGSENDRIISNTNNYYFNKLNKQILTSGNIFYQFKNNEILSLDFNFMSYYGWDIPPFITSFVHLENYFHRFQLSLKNLFGNLNLYLKKDESQGMINPGSGILPSKFLQTEYSFYSLWNLDLSESDKLEISGDINLYKFKNLSYKDDNPFQNFFNEDKDFINYGIASKYVHSFTNTFQSTLNLRYTKQNLLNTISGSIEIKEKIFKNTLLNFSAESYSYVPNVTELYGNFTRTDLIFSVRGNSSLKFSRSNKISLDLSYISEFSGLSVLQINPFFELIQNPIDQNTLQSIRTENTGEILRDAQYVNGSNQKLFGSYFLINAVFNKNIVVQSECQIADNKEVEYIPKFKSRLDIILSLSKYGNIAASWFYRTKSYWSEFTVSKENDFYLETGFDGLLPQISVVSLYYDFTLKPFYIFNILHFKISLENVFNSTQKYLPIGNSLNRTFVFAIAGEL